MKKSTKLKLKKIGVRALHTFCQTAITLIPANILITKVDWVYVLLMSLTPAVISIIKSFAVGVPENTIVSDITEEEQKALLEASEDWREK